MSGSTITRMVFPQATLTSSVQEGHHSYELSPAPFSTPKRMKNKNKGLDVPLFLRKTYHMIDSCDPKIASWSDDGETFVVEDSEKLALEIIPQFFKHNNFSSFVRQLNFYGFRKVKTDYIKIDRAIEARESKRWRFAHENFKRGHLHLLEKFRKTNHNNVEREDVDSLKREVHEMRSQISTMSSHIGQLTSLVQTVLTNQGAARKRRKLEPLHMESSTVTHPVEFSTHAVSPVPLNPCHASDMDLLIEDPIPSVNMDSDINRKTQLLHYVSPMDNSLTDGFNTTDFNAFNGPQDDLLRPIPDPKPHHVRKISTGQPCDMFDPDQSDLGGIGIKTERNACSA